MLCFSSSTCIPQGGCVTASLKMSYPQLHGAEAKARKEDALSPLWPCTLLGLCVVCFGKLQSNSHAYATSPDKLYFLHSSSLRLSFQTKAMMMPFQNFPDFNQMHFQEVWPSRLNCAAAFFAACSIHMMDSNIN